MAMKLLKNTRNRELIAPGTVIRFYTVIGVVYEDTIEGGIKMHCLGRKDFAINPLSLMTPVYYEIITEHPPIVKTLDGWDFKGNLIKYPR
jgi:hypothetical protein